jgi:hypothetical protein
LTICAFTLPSANGKRNLDFGESVDVPSSKKSARLSVIELNKICLSREEIAEFTRAHTRARQLAFLRNNGIRHYVDNNGWPVVTLAAIGVAEDPGEAPKSWEHRPSWRSNKAV